VNPITRLALSYSAAARHKRAQLFRDKFVIDENTRILDLGSEDGTNIYGVLQGVSYAPKDVYIADIDDGLISEGSQRFGFTSVLIDESGRLPFPDGSFDIVYCSSVIEHVTVPKEDIWTLRSGSLFKERAFSRQQIFADEIRRVGKGYFVQTPYRYFPLESHSWLPFVGWLPRRALIALLKVTNLFWIKKTEPDWHLLDRKQMSLLFPEGTIIEERSGGLVKSIMAVRCPGAIGQN
jgi:SAM-dependent methyltransferase